MSAGLMLYGLSADGGKTWMFDELKAPRTVWTDAGTAMQQNGRIAQSRNDDGLRWHPICTLAEALAVRDMVGALKDALDSIDVMRFEASRNVDGKHFTNETINTTSAALLMGKNALQKAGHA